MKYFLFFIFFQTAFCSYVQLSTDADFHNHSIIRPKYPDNTYTPFYFLDIENYYLYVINVSLSGGETVFKKLSYFIKETNGGSEILATSTRTDPQGLSVAWGVNQVTSGSASVVTIDDKYIGQFTYITVQYNGNSYANFDGPHFRGELNMLSAGISQVEYNRTRSGKTDIIYYNWIRVSPITTKLTPTSDPQLEENITTLPPDLIFTPPPTSIPIPTGTLSISRSKTNKGSVAVRATLD